MSVKFAELIQKTGMPAININVNDDIMSWLQSLFVYFYLIFFSLFLSLSVVEARGYCVV